LIIVKKWADGQGAVLRCDGGNLIEVVGEGREPDVVSDDEGCRPPELLEEGVDDEIVDEEEGGRREPDRWLK
jgi:hypothetical protein